MRVRLEVRPILVRVGFSVLVVLPWILLSTIQVSSKSEGRWYKGNLHTHTINSDGDSSPDVVARWYKENRYNFLVLSDHNYLTDPKGLNSIFAAEERSSCLWCPSFLLISGEEVTSGFEKKPVHVNAFNLHHTLPPMFGKSVLDTLQKNVDAIREVGGIPSLNHPNYHWAITPTELSQVRNLRLFEIFNGTPRTHDFGGGGTPGLEEMWDIVLSAGNRAYGIAVDDAHEFKVFGPEYGNPGRGWVNVKARELSVEAILESLERGHFYSSTGVVLTNIEWFSDGLQIDIVPAKNDDRKYTVDFIGKDGELLERSFDNNSSYTLRPGQLYVRAKVTSSDGEMAWVQPVFARP